MHLHSLLLNDCHLHKFLNYWNTGKKIQIHELTAQVAVLWAFLSFWLNEKTCQSFLSAAEKKCCGFFLTITGYPKIIPVSLALRSISLSSKEVKFQHLKVPSLRVPEQNAWLACAVLLWHQCGDIPEGMDWTPLINPRQQQPLWSQFCFAQQYRQKEQTLLLPFSGHLSHICHQPPSWSGHSQSVWDVYSHLSTGCI